MTLHVIDTQAQKQEQPLRGMNLSNLTASVPVVHDLVVEVCSHTVGTLSRLVP